MNTDSSYVVLMLGSNFRRSTNLKKGLNLIKRRYTILKKSRLYKSDDTTQRGRFYWNLALLLKMKTTDRLKSEMINIERKCGRSRDPIKKIIALDIDIALTYSCQSNSLKYKVLTANIDNSLHSFLSLKDILPSRLNLKNFFSDTYNNAPQARQRKINLVSILEISDGQYCAL